MPGYITARDRPKRSSGAHIHITGGWSYIRVFESKLSAGCASCRIIRCVSIPVCLYFFPFHKIFEARSATGSTASS